MLTQPVELAPCKSKAGGARPAFHDSAWPSCAASSSRRGEAPIRRRVDGASNRAVEGGEKPSCVFISG